jgi:zinc/manganese transport system substrate-binding protein
MNRRQSRSSSSGRARIPATLGILSLALLAGLGLTSCSSTNTTASGTGGVIRAIGAESQYADVLAQVGGKYVAVTSILNNPNTDPHTFEASASIAQELATAQLIVQNGVGYDAFMTKIESATSGGSRTVIVAQTVLGLPDSTPNPHLWYDPKTMPAVATAIATALAKIDPSHKAYFDANLATFIHSLSPWEAAISQFRAARPATTVAVTEPVADYLLQAMGMNILTPFTFQADIMNGVDPSPEAITQEQGFLTSHHASVFCYNQQVVDSLTTSIRQSAVSAGVPVVGVYETMPTPGYDYQSWMLAEVKAIEAAVEHGTSTEKL